MIPKYPSYTEEANWLVFSLKKHGDVLKNLAFTEKQAKGNGAVQTPAGTNNIL